jgi:CheY-like chemotaxis protein
MRFAQFLRLGRLFVEFQSMPLIVALQRDPAQSAALRSALSGVVEAEIVVADSASSALAVVDSRMPDLILVDALIPPSETDDVLAYLGIVPDARHVQAISVPLIPPSSDCEASTEASRRQWSLKRMLRSSRSDATALCWDPGGFAADVMEYLSRSVAMKKENERRTGADPLPRASERRRASRWSALEVPFASPVAVMTERAELVNLSSSGVLVRTSVRPCTPRAGIPDPYFRNRSAVTLYLHSGEEIRQTAAPVRCRPRSLGDGRFLYEVAFRFDEPLEVPGLADDGDADTAALTVRAGDSHQVRADDAFV